MNDTIEESIDCPVCGWHKFILYDIGLFCPKCRTTLTLVER